MIKHQFSDFSYAVNTESAKKGYKEILVCYIYNGVEVLKRVYIPEGKGISYVFEARKIIDKEIKDGTLSSYSYRFVRRNKKNKIKPKKIVKAVNEGKTVASVSGFTAFNYIVKPSSSHHKKFVEVSYLYNGEKVIRTLKIRGKENDDYVAKAKEKINKEVDSGFLVKYSEKYLKEKQLLDSTPTKTPVVRSGFTGKTIAAIAVVAILAIAGMGVGMYFLGKSVVPTPTPPPPTPPVSDKYDVVFDTSDTFIKYEGESTVKAKAAYTCTMTIDKDKADPTNFEVNKENVTVYAGKSKLNEGEDYALLPFEEGEGEEGRSGYKLSIEDNTIKDTLFISARSIERSALEGEEAFIFNNETKTITDLRLKAGQKREKITEINIPDTIHGIDVDNIEGGLLNGCSSLRKITLPFVGLSKNLNINIGGEGKVGEVSEKQFLGAIFGKSAFPNAETPTYQDYWYWKQNDQDEIVYTHVLIDFAIPNTLREINVTHYNYVTYNDSDPIYSIPLGAFSECAYITDVAITDEDNPTVSIDKLAFAGCRALRSFIYANSESQNAQLELEIGEKAFSGCGVLMSFDFSSVTTIRTSAFESCAGMVSVFLPETVENIESGAFNGYVGLIKCQASERQSGWSEDWADQITPVVYNVDDKDVAPITDSTGKYSCLIVNYQEEKAVYIVQFLGSLDGDTTFDIENDLEFSDYPSEQIKVRYIGSESFMDFNKTTSIKVKCKNLISIGPEAFKKCLELKEIEFDSEAPIESIGSSAFETCPSLEKVSGLPSTITSIGNYAFYDCPELTSETLSSSFSNVTEVGISAFENDVKLTSISLYNQSGEGKDKCVKFGSNAFKNCNNLASIEYKTIADEEGNYVIPDYCFYGTAIQNIIIPQCTTSVGTATYAYCQSASSVSFKNESSTLTNQVKTIGPSAFLRCTHVTSAIQLPATLTSIGESAFQDCYRLPGIDCLSENLNAIPGSICYGDSKLDYFIYAGDSKITSIGAYAFAQDQNLDYIGIKKGSGTSDNILPGTLRSIGDRAFINCVSLGETYDASRPLAITYTEVEGAESFDMGEQVFYGWFRPGTDTVNREQTVQIDQHWVSSGTSTRTTTWGWTLTKVGSGSSAYYTYYQSDSDWGNLRVTIK